MSHELFNSIPIQFTVDESPVSDQLLEKSPFLRYAHPLQLNQAVLPAVPTLKKDKTLELWTDVLPTNGQYEFYLGAELPYSLPTLGNAPDYEVRVNDAELIISTRMVRCFHSSKDEHIQLQYWLSHRRGLPALLAEHGQKQLHPVPIRTLVSRKFVVEALSAESAIQNNFNAWIANMASDVSLLTDAMRAVSPDNGKHMLPIITPNNFLSFFLTILGESGKMSTIQIMSHTDQIGFVAPYNLSNEATERLKAFLDAKRSIPIEDHAIGLARTFLHRGYYELALVQVCVACESALATAYRDHLLSRGVSNKKYKEAEKDISYSNLLNLHLATLKDLSDLDQHESIIGMLNKARKQRNEIVHSGSTEKPIVVDDVEAAINAACSLIGFIRPETVTVAAEGGFSSST